MSETKTAYTAVVEPTRSQVSKPAAVSSEHITFDRVIDLTADRYAMQNLKKSGLDLKVGETVKIICDENPTTGFKWILKEDEARNIYKIETKYVTGNHGHGRMGVGGQRDIYITALAAGQTHLVGDYARSWEFQGFVGDYPSHVGLYVPVTVKSATQQSYGLLGGNTYQQPKPVAQITFDREYDLTDSRAMDNMKKTGLKLKVGETIKIICSENASTGYGWSLKEDEGSDIYKVETKYVSGSHARGMTGVPGTREIYITAIAPGNTHLVGDYARSWEFKGFVGDYPSHVGLYVPVTVERAYTQSYS